MTPALMRVFTSMCWHLNEDFICWPSQDLLAAEIGVTKQAVSKSIAQLIALGYVEIIRRGYRGNGQTNVYRVIFQRNTENYAEKYGGNSGKSRNAEKSPDAPALKNLHSQPHVDSIVNLTLTHSQPHVVQKYTNEDNQRRSSSKVIFQSNSLAQSAENAAETPPTVTAPPDRRTRERLDISSLKRDPLVIALIACFGREPANPREWDQWRIARNNLTAGGAKAADIPRYIRGYQAIYPRSPITPMALAAHQSEIREGKAHDLAQLEIAQRASATAQNERRERERADAERRAREADAVERFMRERGYGARS